MRNTSDKALRVRPPGLHRRSPPPCALRRWTVRDNGEARQGFVKGAVCATEHLRINTNPADLGNLINSDRDSRWINPTLHCRHVTEIHQNIVARFSLGQHCNFLR